MRPPEALSERLDQLALDASLLFIIDPSSRGELPTVSYRRPQPNYAIVSVTAEVLGVDGEIQPHNVVLKQDVKTGTVFDIASRTLRLRRSPESVNEQSVVVNGLGSAVQKRTAELTAQREAARRQ